MSERAHLTEYEPVEYWDRRGRERSIGLEVPDRPGEEMLRVIRANQTPSDGFLEVGAGQGRIFLFLERNGAVEREKYVMCDIAWSNVVRCSEATGRECDIWDGVTLPYFSNWFEWVLSYSVLLHVPPAAIRRHIEELARVANRWVFVSTYDGPDREFAPHCFKHDYSPLFAAAGLREVSRSWHEEEQQMQWLLEVEIAEICS